MTILTTCLSGLLAITLAGAQVEDVPDVCVVLLQPQWSIEMDVTHVERPAPGQAEGLITHVVSAEGCEADLFFPVLATPIRLGDHLRITGTTQDGMVIVGKVERLVRKSAA